MSGITLGSGFMAGHVVVFDREEDKVGFVTSSCGSLDLGGGASIAIPGVYGPYARAGNASCAPTDMKCPQSTKAKDDTATTVLMVAGVTCAVIFLILASVYICGKRKPRGSKDASNPPDDALLLLQDVRDIDFSHAAPEDGEGEGNGGVGGSTCFFEEVDST